MAARSGSTTQKVINRFAKVESNATTMAELATTERSHVEIVIS